MSTVALTVSLAVSAALVWCIWAILQRLLPGVKVTWTPALRWIVGGAAVLFGIGVWWGWPAGNWAPDEMWAETLINALSLRFSDGWFEIYPPFHFYVLSVVAGPLLLADAFSLSGLSPESLLHTIALLSRGLSVAMSLGLLILLARFAEQTAGRDHGWTTALCVATTLPLVFYAKTANMDVPYLFWFAASLLFFRASLGHREAEVAIGPLAGFAATAALAVTTKDQAYGLYVIPIVWLVFQTIRRPRGLHALAVSFVVGTLVFAIVHNLWFNLDGFRKHVELILGDGSEGYRLFPATLAGEWQLLKLTLWQSFWCLGVPGVILLTLGIWRERRQPRLPAWLWLFPVSYLLTFIAAIGYVYDRFLLGPLLVTALFSASGLRWLLGQKAIGRSAAVVLAAWLVWRAASVDVLLVRDSRYAAETWLRSNAADATIASVWQAGYLPRFRGLRHQEIRPTLEATMRANPDVVVVNTEYVNRYPADAPQPKWLAWLESSDGPYREVFRYKAPLRFTELRWWESFVDRRETLFTNLDKANPEIVIFKKK